MNNLNFKNTMFQHLVRGEKGEIYFSFFYLKNNPYI
jgi:hypothetical protein